MIPKTWPSVLFTQPYHLMKHSTLPSKKPGLVTPVLSLGKLHQHKLKNANLNIGSEANFWDVKDTEKGLKSWESQNI